MTRRRPDEVLGRTVAGVDVTCVSVGKESEVSNKPVAGMATTVSGMTSAEWYEPSVTPEIESVLPVGGKLFTGERNEVIEGRLEEDGVHEDDVDDGWIASALILRISLDKVWNAGVEDDLSGNICDNKSETRSFFVISESEVSSVSDDSDDSKDEVDESV